MDDIRRRWRPDDHRHHRGRTPDGLRTGPDPADSRSGSAGAAAANQHVPAGEGIEDEHRKFISVVLNDTEEVWTQLFRDYVRGGGDHEPKLIIFSGQTTTGCCIGHTAMGPFYCPADQQIYIDRAFFADLA